MSRNVKISLSLAVTVVVVLAGFFLWSASRDGGGSAQPAPASTATAAADPQVRREDSYVLGDEAATGVTFVEFLDFECEACGAWYPVVEDLRQTYDGQVTFVARYFPLGGHLNAMSAALAVEAAAQQGQFEDMYSKMYETQSEWGDQAVSHVETFRGFAQNIGLDMDAYDAVVADPQTRERVESDVADGLGLGVQGTPTFFLDGQRVEPQSPDELAALFEAAIQAAGRQG